MIKIIALWEIQANIEDVISSQVGTELDDKLDDLISFGIWRSAVFDNFSILPSVRLGNIINQVKEDINNVN